MSWNDDEPQSAAAASVASWSDEIMTIRMTPRRPRNSRLLRGTPLFSRLPVSHLRSTQKSLAGLSSFAPSKNSVARSARRQSFLFHSSLVGLFPVGLAVLALLFSGCQRSHYRIQADDLVHDVVSDATANPRFEVPDFNIAIDPRSRLFDPTDPDYPPMAPDDPDSNRLMQSVAGHRGYPRWHCDGDLPDVETSDYRAWLPYADDGKVRVDLIGTVELARLHSRDYQGQLETLYLSALDVTAERFRFYSQFYGGNVTQ